MSLAKTLRDLLDKKGMTAYALAKKTGVTNTTLSAILRGENTDPQVSTIKKIAQGLGVSPSALVASVEND